MTVNQSNSSTGSHYSEISASPLKNFELLLEKLKIQFYFCFGGIPFTILGYLAISSLSQCCELPFQESSCTAGNILPPLLTNHSTLAKEVNEFIANSQVKISNLHDIIEMPSLADRQKTLESISDEIRELIQEHSANLAAFGAIKREDERREELEVAVSDGYIVLYPFGFLVLCFYIVIVGSLNEKSRRAKWNHFNGSEKLSAEESDNFRNARQKIVKRQIPIFYMATFICFMVQMGLYAAFFKSQYYTGHCPIYGRIESFRQQASRRGETYLPKSFTDYHTFADKLQSTLDLHLEELNKTMQSPILEVRQLGWKYEYNSIEAAFKHHLELKQYHVDRKVMPREISYGPRDGLLCFLLILCLMCNILVIGYWATQEGSVWQPRQFIKIYF